MPKKFKGENSKAAVAKARKAEAQASESAKVEKEKEDAYWRDDDKHVAKKQQRKAGRETKKQDAVARKQEARKLLEEEEAAVPVKTTGKAKLTRAEIEADQERQREEAEQAKREKDKIPEVPLEENPNIALARAAAEGQLEARSVEDAIAALDVNEPAVDKHPEKRMKAAYRAFEEINLPILKAENPNLRLSQLKQMLKKDWAKSPDNPLNQRLANANS